MDTYPIIHPTHSGRSRESMPQIPHEKKFLRWLERQGIHHRKRRVSYRHLKPTQNEVNLDLALQLVPVLDTRKHPILVARDYHILDGHNRWYAARIRMTNCTVTVVDLGIRALLEHAERYPKARHEDIADIDRAA